MNIKEFSKQAKLLDFKHYDVVRWVAFAGTILFCVSMSMFFLLTNDQSNPTGKITSDTNVFVVVWMGWFGFFTVQSNILVGIYMLMYWLNPKKKAVNGNFLVYMIAYITITFLLYAGLLMPEAARSGKMADWGARGWTLNLVQHFLVPFSAFVMYGSYIWKNKKQYSTKKTYFQTVLLGMIYPCCYVAYAILLPFISNHTYSAYGKFTNLDPKLVIDDKAGNPTALIYIFGALVLFIIVLCLYDLPYRKLNKRTNG